MAHRNRVDPHGHLIVTSARGQLMGNRGCLHDANGNLTGRRWTTTTWISCRLEFKGRWRPIMPPQRYTALFFLDEATALAAGHRPCGECRHADYGRFKAAWCQGNRRLGIGSERPVREIDAVLHGERLSAKDRPIVNAGLDTLPDGAMFLFEKEVWVVAGKRIARWAPGGYDKVKPRPRGLQVSLLTPPSIIRAIQAGYIPGLHPSAG